MSGGARVPGPRGAHAQPSEVSALPTPGPTSIRDSLDVLANIQRASRRLATVAATSAPTEGEADGVGRGQRHESTNNSSSTSPRAALTTPSSHQALLAAHDASMLSLQYRGGLPGGEEAAAGRRSLSPPESVGTAAPRRSSSSDRGNLSVPPPLTSLPSRSALTTAASPLADGGVTQIQLSPYASRPATDNAPRTAAPAAPSPATPAEELLRTRQQLAELQRLYSFEKKAQLQQRAQQLRGAAEQQHEDGDVVAQATQIVAEYEALVRLRADASREQLEAALRRIAEAWKTEAVQLEHTRAACEADLLQRLQASVGQQREVLSQQLQRHLIAVAHATVEAERGQEAAVAAAVQEQVSAFKDEYRRLLEQDMHERQRLMDAQVAHREAQWRTFLKEEHARMIAAGEAAAQELSRRQRESLHLALRDMTELRQRLLDENAQRQARTAQEYLVAYENLAGEHATAALEAVEYVQQLQHDYAAVIRALHVDVRRATAEKQEAERRLEQSAVQVAEAVAHELHVVEEKAEARWRHRWEAEQEAHRDAVAQLTRTHAEALESARDAAADTEAQLQRAHERALASLRDQLTSQQASEAARTAASTQRTQATVERLEHEKAELRSALQASKDEQRRAELVHAAALLETQRASEAQYATQLAELEATYDDVVLHYRERVHAAAEAAAATASSPTSAAATATASAAALRRVVELEKEVQELTAQRAQAVRQAASEAAALWSGRLDAARTQHRADAEELEGQHRELRQRLLDEAARRETEMEERCVALRQSHAAELRDVVSREKAAAQAATSRLERQLEAVQREAAAAAQARVQACEDAMRVREEQLVAAQAAWQRRRVEESDQLSRALTQQAATQLAEQAGELETGEAALREAQAALAQQQASALRDARTTARREAEERLAEQQRAAEATWLTLMHAELRNRYVSWQESRAQELAMLRAAHRDELQLLHGYYAAQLSNAHEAQRQCLEAERKAMQKREAAWAATRAAALSDHRTGVAEVLREVLATEAAALEAAREHQRELEPHIREAALSAVAAHLREHTAASAETTARLEADMRARYVAVLEQQESAASAMLAEQRQAHEDALAQLHADVATAAAAQASRAAQEAARSEAAHRAHVLELTKAYEQRLAEQRERHDAALAAERTAAQERTARVQEELDAARETRAQAAAFQAQDLHRAYAQQVAELQARCETLTTQLRAAETASHLSTLQVRQEQEAKLRSEYEVSIASLRDALEERNHAYAALQTSLYTRVQAEADRVQASGAEKLADFMAGQQQQLADALAAHEAALVALQQRHQEALAAQRHTHEQALQAQVSRLHDTHAAALASQQAQWATHEARWTALLEDERRARSAAEERANAAAVTQAQSRVCEAEQQAAAYRHLDDEYRDLLEHLRDDVQAEREELARRSLEDEEHRFVSAMLHQRQRAQQPQQQQNRAEQEARTRAAPQRSPQPPRRRRPAASRLSTPVALRAQEMPSSPLPISPAAPVELTHAVDVPEYDERQTDDGAMQLVRAATPRLRQLWDVLEVPLEEQQAFISHAEALAHAQEQRHWAADRPTSAPASLVELRAMLTHEQRRLEAQLPLLEALTRREYVQRQLRSLASTSTPPSLASLPLNVPFIKEQHDEADGRSRDTGGVDDVFEDGAETTMRSSSSAVSAAVSPPVKQQRSSDAAGQLSRMQDELQRLTAQLRQDVTQHEKLYGQLFCLNGRRVMEAL